MLTGRLKHYKFHYIIQGYSAAVKFIPMGINICSNFIVLFSSITTNVWMDYCV